MKTRTMKVMDPTKLIVIGSSQKRLMRRKMKKKEMGLSLILRVTILRIYKWTHVLST
jgi:hypothetical protein